MSLGAAAEKHNIPKQTLSAHIKGRVPARESVQPGAHLTRLKEEKVVNWIKHQEQLGFTPIATVVRSVVTRLLEQKGDIQPLGRKWIEGFKKRHNDIGTKISRR